LAICKVCRNLTIPVILSLTVYSGINAADRRARGNAAIKRSRSRCRPSAVVMEDRVASPSPPEATLFRGTPAICGQIIHRVGSSYPSRRPSRRSTHDAANASSQMLGRLFAE